MRWCENFYILNLRIKLPFRNAYKSKIANPQDHSQGFGGLAIEY